MAPSKAVHCPTREPFRPSPACGELGIPEATLRGVARTRSAKEPSGARRLIYLTDVWTAGAAATTRALEPGHRDGANLAAATLKCCRMPMPGVGVLTQMRAGDFGSSSLEREVKRTIREDVIDRLVELQSWSETVNPADEHLLRLRMDRSQVQHLEALIARVESMEMAAPVYEKVCATILADWDQMPPPKRSQDGFSAAAELRRRLRAARSSGRSVRQVT